MLFVHATGFHARIWDEIVGILPARHTVCIDMHGHGHSSGAPITHWRVFCDELTGFVEALDLSDIAVIGHSMGGHAAIAAAAALPSRFLNLVLIDPVVMRPERYDQAKKAFSDEELHPTAKRRRDFSTIEEMVTRFENRSPYSLFTRETLLNYCRHALLPKQGGDGLTLACAPEMEASVYMASLSNKGIFDDVRAVNAPVLILRATPAEEGAGISFTESPTWEGLVGVFPNAREIYRPDLTHFMLMEAPEAIAAIIDREIAGS